MVRILVCDDDPTTRFLLRRFLARELPCTVAEADNGVAALKLLATDSFDLLMLDLNMPVMNGRETLQVIRDTPEMRSIPVVVLTAEKNELEVQQIIRLGVHAFVLKPVAQERAQARLRDVLAGLRSRGPASASTPVATGPPILEAGRPLLVADGDDDFRHMVVSTLGPRFQISEASNGIDALDAVIKGQIPSVMIGRKLPLLEPDALATKLLGLSDLATRVIAIAPKAEVDALRATGLYDAVIARTFIPDVFEAQIEELLRNSTSSLIDRVRGLVPGFRGSVIAAIQQLLGMVMKMDAEPLSQAPRELEGPFFRGDIHVTLDDRFDIAVGLVCNQASGHAFSKAMLGMESTEDVLCQMTNIVAGRLKNAMTSRGLKASHDLPAVKEIAAKPAVPADGDSLSLNFGVVDQQVYLSVLCSITAMENQVAKAS
jgi:two-component system chemotaxis response regulator CheY